MMDNFYSVVRNRIAERGYVEPKIIPNKFEHHKVTGIKAVPGTNEYARAYRDLNRHTDEYKARRKKYNKRYFDKMKQDPAKLSRYKEQCRLNKERWKTRHGMKTAIGDDRNESDILP